MSAKRLPGRVGLRAMLCAAMALAWCLPSAQAADDKPAASESTTRKPATPDEAWAAATPHMNRAIGEARKALDERIAVLDAFFTERKAGARPFAEAVLGMEGKGRAAVAVGAVAIGGLAELFGEKPDINLNAFPDYIRGRFCTLVLNPAQVKQAIDAAVAGFQGDLDEIEGRLLVDLRTDIDDALLDVRGIVPKLRAEEAAAGNIEAVIADTLDTAGKDLVASIGMFLLSNELSKRLSHQVLPTDASMLRQQLTGFLTGMATDEVLDQVARQAGYDPEAEVITKATAGIDRIRSLVIDGDRQELDRFVPLYRYREGHPDQRVRADCDLAVRLMEGSANLGLRTRFILLHNERVRRRTAALIAHIYGPEAAKAPVSVLPAIDPKDAPDSASIRQAAEEVRLTYGETR